MSFSKLLWTPLCMALLALTLLAPTSNFAVAQSQQADIGSLTGRHQAQAIIAQLLKNDRIILSSDVHRGMRGYALSVFRGTEIEKFPIEVLGVLQKVQGGGDVVLIKVLGGPVVERQSGIVAGMSGSPVYIDGKMLGAIALGWAFPKEPIGGVTPITEMIHTSLPDSGTEPEAKTIAAIDPAQSTRPDVYVSQNPLTVGGKKISRVVVDKNPGRLAMNLQPQAGTAVMRPTKTLLQVSGFSEDALPELKQLFEPYGLEPFIGPSSKKLGVPSPRLEPGSAIGVQLVSGDMNQTAIGTVTFRWGDRILAFGHPMFGQGAASLPMTTAYVHDIFPSYQRSFKLASPIDVVGAILQDTQFAIGGTLHAKADTIPMRIKLQDDARQIDKTFNVEVMNDPRLTPQLVVMVAQQAVQSTLGLTSDKMVEISMRLEVEETEPIVRHNLLYSRGVISRAALTDLMQSIAVVQSNKFAKGTIRSIALEVEVEPGRKVAAIKSITANRNKVKAGESLQVNVVLQPTTNPSERITRTFTFQVPKDAPAGTMKLVAAASANYWPMKASVGGPTPDPHSLPELIELWNKVGALNELMVMASTPDHFLRVDEQNIQNPPPTWTKLLGSSPSTSVKRYNQVDIQKSLIDYTITGAKSLSIPVESANKTIASTDNDDSTDGDVAEVDNGEADNSALTDDVESNDLDDPNHTTKSTFGINSANWNSTQNWVERSWQQMMQFSGIAIPAQMPPSPPAPPVPDSSEDDDASEAVAAIAAAAKAAAAQDSTSTTESTPETIGSSETLGRPALNWVDAGTASFLKGDFHNAIVDSNGIIRPAPNVKQLATTALPFIWSIAGDQSHNVYLGTGADNSAEIYRVDAAGNKSLFFETAGIAVTALTVDQANNLYAAVSPSGQVYRISPNGKAKVLFDSQQPFAWVLTWDANGQLLIGTGGEHGKLFRIDPSAAKSTFSQTPLHAFAEGHVRAIDVAPDGTIYAGTGASGVLYQIDPASGNAKALYEVTAPSSNLKGEVLAVAASADGVYFGTSVNGTLYRWKAGNGVEALYPSPQQAVYALQLSQAGELFMATGNNGVVYGIQPGKNAANTKAARILEPTQLQALSLYLVKGNQSQLLVGTGNNGAAFQIPLATAANGSFVSQVYDADRLAQWGALRAVQDNTIIKTRSGNTTSPDITWSDWAEVKQLAGGEMQVNSPPARYLQYKLLLTGHTKNPSAFARIAISYRTENQPPRLGITAPQGGEYWSGKKSITWTAKDPDKDTLSYTLSLLGADKKWTSLSEDPLKASPFELDTTKSSDGTYQLRITASDVLSNPLDALTATSQTLPFILDNTPPEINNARIELQDKRQLVLADITDATSPITGIEWRIVKDTPAPKEEEVEEETTKPKKAETKQDTSILHATKLASEADSDTDKEATDDTDKKASDETDKEESTDAKTEETDETGWHALAPADGLFDSTQESAIGILVIPSKDAVKKKDKPLQIELRAHDAAGNKFTVTIDVPA